MTRLLAMNATIWLFASCASDPNPIQESGTGPITSAGPRAMVAVLDSGTPAFNKLRATFLENNPGYGLAWLRDFSRDHAVDSTRVLFIQGGTCAATVMSTSRSDSDLRVGDIVVLRAGETFTCDRPVNALAFEIPTPPPDSVPAFVRPDFDPLITDRPGGCAEEEDAYRRILLTWQGKVGPYLYHAINAHRVRILDSFTHYHPAVGGFDEFYLVQEAPPGAELIVSEHLEAIQGIAAVTRDDVPGLLRRIPLSTGDLIYLPRTVVHRGIGGAVVQVITVPGFVPGAEIGVDADLARLNRELNLSKSEALPLNSRSTVPEPNLRE